MKDALTTLKQTIAFDANLHTDAVHYDHDEAAHLNGEACDVEFQVEAYLASLLASVMAIDVGAALNRSLHLCKMETRTDLKRRPYQTYPRKSFLDLLLARPTLVACDKLVEFPHY